MTQAITTAVAAAATLGTPWGMQGGQQLTGYNSIVYAVGTTGGTISTTVFGYTVLAAGNTQVGAPHYVGIQLSGGAASTIVTATFINAGNSTTTTINNPTFYASGSTVIFGQNVPALQGPLWTWSTANEFTLGSQTTIILQNSNVAAPAGNGDIMDPEAWQDNAGNIPPLEFSAVPYNTNFPLNGDGRYWFQANAYATNTSGPITFIGNPLYLVNTAAIQWSVEQVSTDGSSLLLAYSTTTGSWTTTTLLPQIQLGGIQNGVIEVPLFSTGQFQIQIYAQSGTALSTAALSQVAIAITRNANEGLQWDAPNPFNPQEYNSLATDNVVPTDTLATLRSRILVRLGFSNQAANPPPGMAALVNDFLQSGQRYLYRRYLQLHTKRNFRWKVNPGQRFYSLRDNDEGVLEQVNMDYAKTVEWVGIQDSRNVWYPMIQGIPPQLFTMITKPWRPARYELRGAIEIYPAPDQTYWLWIRGHFGLKSFVNDSDFTTLDSELVFLHALANAKAHYGQPDANSVESQANNYRLELIAGTHQTAHYVPGTIAVPPAVRPTLIQFDANNGGGA